ncbi:MAG: nitroreductase family protein [Dictyoglomaceae bacterium]|nr:nitroreductase family protein [Dictyoglomaceae bacterium]
MDVKDAIYNRRAYRLIEPIEITEELIKDLGEKASLSPSCFNNQPWRFIFVYEREVLEKLFTALSSGNKWATNSSLIVVVFTKKDLDCVIKEREYALFDTGIATGFMILRAVELGLVAHPIAGYDEEKVKEILDIPKDMTVITLLVFGKKTEKINPLLSEDQIEREKIRPQRLSLDKILYLNKYTPL